MPSPVQVSISNIEKGSSIEEIAREFYKELKLFNSIWNHYQNRIEKYYNDIEDGYRFEN